jgi:hypothetical protein
MRKIKNKNEEEGLDYEVDLNIDTLDLEIEWLKQPNLFFKYSSALAKAKKERRKAHVNMLAERARIRKKLMQEGSKVTEAILEEEVAAAEEWNIFKLKSYEEDLLEGAVSAMHQKRAALQNLVELLSLGYYSTPNEPKKMNNSTVIKKRISEKLNKQGGN